MPRPAHPHARRSPLPTDRPKPEHEDPHAPRRVQAILDSPSYRQADEDIDFLNRDDVRGLRLQLDYLKPELLLRQHGIGHTIVVFGSTRIAEPRAARRVGELNAALDADADNAALQRRSPSPSACSAKSRYYDVAREFGQLVGSAERPHGNAAGGDDRRRTGDHGGGKPRRLRRRGASVGLNITLPHEQFPNPYVTPDLCFRFHYFALRKLHFLKRARALVAFPGGYGTFDELFETLTLIQTRKIAPLPIILVGEEYWRRAFDPDFLVAEGMIDAEDRELFWFAEIGRGNMERHPATGTRRAARR